MRQVCCLETGGLVPKATLTELCNAIRRGVNYNHGGGGGVMVYGRDCKGWMIIGVDKQCPRNLHYLCYRLCHRHRINILFWLARGSVGSIWWKNSMVFGSCRCSCQHLNRRHEIVELIFLVFAWAYRSRVAYQLRNMSICRRNCGRSCLIISSKRFVRDWIILSGCWVFMKKSLTF